MNLSKYVDATKVK